MSTIETSQAPGARTGEQFLEGLRRGGREVWLRGEQISHPLEHPELRGAALSLARVFDLQHEHADEMLAPSPDAPDRRVNVTHLIPRTHGGSAPAAAGVRARGGALRAEPWAARRTT